MEDKLEGSHHVDHSLGDRLTNADLAPSTDRSWGAFSIFAMQSCTVHSLGTYTFASALFFLGLVGWQVFLAILVGISIVFFLMNKTGYAGTDTRVTYPVFARISFGVFGANLPALIRAIVAIAWYGIQTWLASVAVVVLLVSTWPSLGEYTKNSFLGLSTLGWISFLGLWLFQLIVIRRGMDTIKKFQDFAGPAIWVVMAVMAIWLFFQAGGKFSLDVTDHRVYGWDAVRAFAIGVCMVLSYSATLLLNFMDFSRLARDRKAVSRGNFWGLPVNYIALGATIVVTTSASVVVFGKALTDPVEIVKAINNPWVTVIGAVVFIIATIGINVVANFVSAAYDLAHLAPRWINFKRGGLISAVIAIFILPWHLYESPLAITYFLGGLGALLGPLYGVIFADYYLVRRAKVDVKALYSQNPQGPYFYRKGWNPLAIWSFAGAAVVTIPIALVPVFSSLATFAWPIGVVIAGGIYLLLNRGRRFDLPEYTASGQLAAELAAATEGEPA